MLNIFCKGENYFSDSFSGFTTVDSYPVTIDNVGYFAYKPPTDVWLSPGHFLGFSGGLIGYR